MSLFVLASKDGWVNIMYNGLDAVAVDQQVGAAGPGLPGQQGSDMVSLGPPGLKQVSPTVSHTRPSLAWPVPFPLGLRSGWCRSLLRLLLQACSLQGERCELALSGGLQSPWIEKRE